MTDANLIFEKTTSSSCVGLTIPYLIFPRLLLKIDFYMDYAWTILWN